MIQTICHQQPHIPMGAATQKWDGPCDFLGRPRWLEIRVLKDAGDIDDIS